MQVKKCLYCEKEFETDNKQKEYCTPKCARAGYYKKTFIPVIRDTKVVQCRHCGCDMTVNTFGRVPKYCSRSCKNKFKHAKKNPTGIGQCAECGKEIVLHFGKNGKTKNKFCSQYCGDKHNKRINKERISTLRNKPERRYNVYSLGAKQRNIDFNLTFDQFLTFWNKPCYYCGDMINGVGIDRINNSIGYEIDNCVSCCKDCNRMKLKMSKKDFITQCIKVAQIHSHNTNTKNI